MDGRTRAAGHGRRMRGASHGPGRACGGPGGYGVGHAARVTGGREKQESPGRAARTGRAEETDVVARDPENIQREIEKTRDALAESLDALADRANPKNLIEGGKEQVAEKLADPKIKYSLIAVGALVGLVVIRSIFR